MDIKFSQLSKEQEDDVIAVLTAAIDASDPYKCVKEHISLNENRFLAINGHTYDLDEINRLYLIGAGKASLPMASAVMEKIGGFIHSGIVISKHKLDKWTLPEKITVCLGSHPVPTKESIQSTQLLVNFVKRLRPEDLIINLISGGGSALMTMPFPGINLDDVQLLTKKMLSVGATIQEINTIRKHIDCVKGGGLARMAGKAVIETLILSDVLGDDISMIASGPTCADETTFSDAMGIIEKYELAGEISRNIVKHLQKGIEGKVSETVKLDDPILINKHHQVIASLTGSIVQAAAVAAERGYHTRILSNTIIGEAREVGKMSGSILKTLADTSLILPRPAMIIGGGETTVRLTGNGKGGRNQEISFGAIEIISGCENCALVSIATDGEDGPTNAAGAYVTGKTEKRAREKGLRLNDYGITNDTYHLFDHLDNLIRTGPTGTNVNDLLLLIAF